ncbi:MAG: hypothetical protein V4622_13640 [Bacteroidota bacterium]
MNFSEYKDTRFVSDVFFKKNEILDEKYHLFLKEFGDGFYFNNALHIYGQSKINDFHDLDFRTSQILKFFQQIIDFKEIKCFGEDAFGNQFIFYEKGIGMITIETGEIEFIAQNFDIWLKELENNSNNYTGESLFIEWEQLNGKIMYDERLTPKMPFVFGGGFEIENLYKSNFSKIIEFNSDLARQILDSPDGSSIELRII